MPGTPGPDPISTRRQRIAELARQSPQAAFTTLAHHIDIDWLTEAYRRTRKDGAVGVDGQTAKDCIRHTDPILHAMVRSPRTDPSVPRGPQHGETRWQAT
jgi:hypothetical protein